MRLCYEYGGNSFSEDPHPFSRLRGRGNKARENRLRLHPHPVPGAGKRRALKWEIEARVGPIQSPCSGSLPACRFKIPFGMAQATPAL